MCVCCLLCFFCFKQKTAYEMRISDWSSDVCSSDLEGQRPSRMDVIPAGPTRRRRSAEAKARIIASSFEPGANIAEIARTHGLLPQQLYAWRHDSIPGKRLAGKKLSFVPAVIEEDRKSVVWGKGVSVRLDPGG